MRSRSAVPLLALLLVTLLAATAACGSGAEPTAATDDSEVSAPVSTPTTASPGPGATTPASPTTTPASPTIGGSTTTVRATGGVPAADGIVAVSLEEVGGIFVEGFEVGLRFEDGNGKRLGGTLWSDFIRSLDGEPSMDRWYDSVLEQVVPAGTVVVRAAASVGMGPGPSVPDIDGPLPCELTLDVPAGNRVRVEVSFTGTDQCLRQLP